MTNKKLLRRCPICDAAEGSILYTQKFIVPDDFILPKEYDVVVCGNCGFSFADTPSNQETYNKFYELQSKYESKVTGSGGGYSGYDLKRLNDTADYIEHDLQLDKNASIADIGCANGGLLKNLKNRGYKNLTGIDPSVICVQNVREQGIECIKGSIFDIQNKTFDFCILSHVMEHIYNLRDAIFAVKKLLSAGGQLYIEVPDSSLYTDFYVVPFYYFDSEHINHFDNISLTNLGASVGLHAVHYGYKSIPVSNNVLYPAVFVVFDKISVTGTNYAELSLRNYINRSSQDSNIHSKISELIADKKEICIWGVGNYTFRLLATTDLAKCDIKYFVDSDSKKTGNGKTLMSKEIVSPQALKDFKGTVVISSALYAKEIEKQVNAINPELKTVLLA